MLQQIAGSLSAAQMVWVQSPVGGSASVEDMERALVHGSRWDSSEQLLSHLVDGSVVVVDDLELWWERREGGLDVIEHLLDLTARHGSRLRFLVGVNRHAFAVMDRLLPLTSSATRVLRCAPFSAEDLRHAIIRRHRSTGLRFALEGRREADFGEWHLARLFSSHFDSSAGNIGAALRGWLAHVTKADEQSIEIARPTVQDWTPLDELDGDQKALLLQLVLHRNASRDRLRRIMSRPDRILDGMVRSLVGAGLLHEHRARGIAISPYLRHQVITHFHRRGLV